MAISISRMNQFKKYFYLGRFKHDGWCIYFKNSPSKEGRIFYRSFKTREEGLEELRIIQEGEW
jgi:hypothetical protein